jgi:hypothetical protein
MDWQADYLGLYNERDPTGRITSQRNSDRLSLSFLPGSPAIHVRTPPPPSMLDVLLTQRTVRYLGYRRLAGNRTRALSTY